MIAKEADLHALDLVMQDIGARINSAVESKDKKMEKAYSRIWLRLQKVYIRTDAALNHVEGNA